jgi:NAD(P)-dependent dehydrogenase (short-subunit alcohol dehydrogenase family)
MVPCAVCGDVESARVLLAGGVNVVLAGRPDAALGQAVADLRAAAGRPGLPRLAAFVGDLDDADVRAAALAMAAEQFGGPAVLVGSVAEARSLIGTAKA